MKGVMFVAGPSNASMKWNIFARELEDILAVRQVRLSQLDNRGIVQHREKARRLQLSLKSPRHLSTLNPEEMDRLVVKMQLTDLEQKRLRAALLATAVEMTLMDRVDPQTALMAANDVFYILFAAMKAQPNMIVTTGVKTGGMIDEQDFFGDALFVQALDLIDRATLALHVSQQAASPQAQELHAREAYDTFSRALEFLQLAQSPQPGSENWLCWYDEAIQGHTMAEVLMQQNEGA